MAAEQAELSPVHVCYLNCFQETQPSIVFRLPSTESQQTEKQQDSPPGTARTPEQSQRSRGMDVLCFHSVFLHTLQLHAHCPPHPPETPSAPLLEVAGQRQKREDIH